MLFRSMQAEELADCLIDVCEPVVRGGGDISILTGVSILAIFMSVDRKSVV